MYLFLYVYNFLFPKGLQYVHTHRTIEHRKEIRYKIKYQQTEKANSSSKPI